MTKLTAQQLESTNKLIKEAFDSFIANQFQIALDKISTLEEENNNLKEQLNSLTKEKKNE